MPKPISFLVPKMPSAEDLLPYLKMIDTNQQYTNQGPLLQQFESALAHTLSESTQSSVFVATCQSGTQALTLSLKALGFQPGNKILLPSFTHVGTLAGVLDAHLTPLLCDVDPTTWQLTPSIAAQICHDIQVDGILPVATFGAPVPISDWENFVDTFNLPVVIDAAGALGNQTLSNSIPVCFSLHATKCLGVGEGGVVASKNLHFVEKLKALSQFNLEGATFSEMGTNGKLSEYHAAVGLARLKSWKQDFQAYCQLRTYYHECLQAVPNLQLQALEHPIASHLMPVQCPEGTRDNLQETLKKNSIETRQYYTPLLHELPFFMNHQPPKSQYFVSELLKENVLCLPAHHQVTPLDCDQIMLTIKSNF